jgi:hypothetical protein
MKLENYMPRATVLKLFVSSTIYGICRQLLTCQRINPCPILEDVKTMKIIVMALTMAMHDFTRE